MALNSNQNPYSNVFISSNYYDSKKIYQKRRKEMLKKLDSLCVFAGIPIEPGSEEAYTQIWNKMIQEPAFVYLTGINQAGCCLLLDPKTGEEILFVPPKDPFKEFWNGKRLGFVEGNKEISKITGIKDVRPMDEFKDTLFVRAKKIPKNGFIYVYFFEKFKGDHNDQFKKKIQRDLSKIGIKVKSVAPLHWKFRLPLEEERVEEAKIAQMVTKNAFCKVLSRLSSFKTERELGLTLDYEMQLKSDGDLAFPTIVACGENACCLHYVKKDEPLQKGCLVLLDFGIRIGTLHSDISRTLPVNGKFNPLQKLLYQIVLDSALEYQKYVKPGVSLREIGDVPWNFIISELQHRLVKQHKGKYKLLYDKRPHGVSHFIGEQIHEGDPGSRSLDVVLKPNMLISCEPGLYGEFEGFIEGKHYHEKIGIRIEDDLLITKKGFVNLSKDIPKSIEEVEKIYG